MDDTNTDGPKYDNYIKLSDTNDEKPALNNTTATINPILLWNTSFGKTVEAWTYKLAKNPKILR